MNKLKIKFIYYLSCTIILGLFASNDSYGQSLTESEAKSQIIYELKENANPPMTSEIYERNNVRILEIGNDTLIPIDQVRVDINRSKVLLVTFECYNNSKCIKGSDKEHSGIGYRMEGFKSAYRLEKAFKALQ